MSEDQDFKKYNNPYPCKFCGMGAGYAPLEEMRKHEMDVYFCHNCKAEYIFFSDGHLASISLYTMINDRMYRWSISGNGKTGYLRYVKDPGLPGVRKNEGMVVIKGFDARDGDSIPVITPQNINEKVRTLLVFI